MLHQAEEIEKETSAPNFWDDSFHAQRQMKLISKLRTRANRWIDIEERIKLSLELLELAQESQDERMISEVSSDTPAIFNEAEELELELVLAGEYDENNKPIQSEVLKNIKDLRILAKKNEIRCYQYRR